jgi:hypothetical protein
MKWMRGRPEGVCGYVDHIVCLMRAPSKEDEETLLLGAPLDGLDVDLKCER